MTGAGSLSERRDRTRDKLVSAALARFFAQSVQATTVAEIAADAGVTERTFYRYFSSKEQILFADYEARHTWFRSALAMRPPREPITIAVRNAVESFPYTEALSQIAALRKRDIESELIDTHIQRVQGAFGRDIEAHILAAAGEAPGPDAAFTAALTAQCIAAAMFTAMNVWINSDQPGTQELQRLTDVALRILHEGTMSLSIRCVPGRTA